MQKVFETVQCASRWSGASLAGSDTDASNVYKPPSAPARPVLSDSLLEDVSDTESEDLYPLVEIYHRHKISFKFWFKSLPILLPSCQYN